MKLPGPLGKSVETIPVVRFAHWTGRFVESPNRELAGDKRDDVVVRDDLSKFRESLAKLSTRLEPRFTLPPSGLTPREDVFPDQTEDGHSVMCRRLRLPDLMPSEFAGFPAMAASIVPCGPSALVKIWVRTILECTADAFGSLDSGWRFFSRAAQLGAFVATEIGQVYARAIQGELVTYSMQLDAFATTSDQALTLIEAATPEDVSAVLGGSSTEDQHGAPTLGQVYLEIISLATECRFSDLRDYIRDEDAPKPEFIHVQVQGKDNGRGSSGLFAKSTVVETEAPRVRMAGLTFAAQAESALDPAFGIVQNYTSLL